MRGCKGRTFHARSIAALLLTVLLLPSMADEQGRDDTLTPEAKGPDIVETVISRLESSCVFPDDKLFVRRLAYVESYDGADPKTFRAGYFGGIWQVDQDMFQVTQSSAANSYLLPYIRDIQTKFGVNWSTVTWQDLNKPLHSALGARLYIQYQSRNDPNGIPRSISAQADFWKRYYRLSGNTNDFTEKAEKLENGCKDGLGPDIVFVLDGSGSIGATNFNSIKNFVRGVVDAFEVGVASTAARFGVIQYGSTIRREFDLKTYSTKSDVLNAVNRITYMGGGTPTDQALNELRINGFSAANGARSGHPKVGVVLTDGVSNSKQLTIAAAQRCHDAKFTMFAIGVGTNLDMSELKAIASDPDCIHMILLSFSDIDSLKYTIQKRSCDAPIDISPGQNSTTGGGPIQLPPGGDQNCRLQISPEGTTVQVATGGGGHSTFYTSKSTYPTSSFYDQMVVSGPDRLGVLFIPKPQDSVDGLIYCNIKGDNQTETNITIGTKPGDHDKCKNHTCLNGATCRHTEGDRGFSCDCAHGYSGLNCEIGICPLWRSYSHQGTAGADHVWGSGVTLNECLDICISNPNCHGVDYDWNDRNDGFDGPCWLQTKPITDRAFNEKSTQYVIDRSCLGKPIPESCYQWTEYPDQQGKGAEQQPRFFTVPDCKETCQWDPLCVAIDYDVDGEARCWLHLSEDNIREPIKNYRVTQYRLRRAC